MHKVSPKTDNPSIAVQEKSAIENLENVDKAGKNGDVSAKSKMESNQDKTKESSSIPVSAEPQTPSVYNLEGFTNVYYMLRKAKELQKKGVEDMLFYMDMCVSMNDDEVEKYAALLVKENFADMAFKFLTEANDVGLFSSNVWFPTFYTMNLLSNVTDRSPEFSKAVEEAGILKICIENLQNKEFWKPERAGDSNVDAVLDNCISVILNISQNSESHNALHDLGVVEVVKKFLHHKSDVFKACSCLTLANLLDETDSTLAAAEVTVCLTILIDYLKHTMKTKDRRYHGFNPEELANGIMKLSVPDPNKILLIENGALTVLYKMLDGGFVSEQCIAARTIWNLCFEENAKKAVMKDEKTIKKLKLLRDCQDKRLRKMVKGALWEMEQESRKVVDKDLTRNENGHIFISYNWQSQSVVLKVAEKLKKLGYKVWIDVDKMSSDLLESMAAAVENASVVLVCMTEQYKESPPCRTECGYAYQLRKPIIPLLIQNRYRPDGWLGAVIGTKFYFDFSGKLAHENVMKNLVKEIRSVLRGKDTTDTLTMPKQSITPEHTHGVFVSKNTDYDITEWKVKDVSKWLKEIGLESCASKFSNVNGTHLRQMLSLRLEAPEFFYQCLKSDLNLTFLEILTLKSGFDKLEH